LPRVAGPAFTARRAAGFGLVELMISMLIGLVIIAALVTLFVNTSGNNRELARANSMIENGRFAIKVLEEDLGHAGYWSGHVPWFDDQTSTAIPGDVPTAVPQPCQDPATWTALDVRNLIGIPVQAYDDGAVAALATCVLDGVVDDYQPGTDVLLIRHTDTCVPGEGGYCEADVAGKVYVQASRCVTEAATPYVFGTSGYTLTAMDCATATEKRKFVSNLYYVRDYAVNPGDGIPTLVRSEFDLDGTLAQQPAVALVEGVEAFRIEFGVDDLSRTGAAVNYNQAIAWQDPMDKTTPTNRGDGVPDGAYVRCTTATPCTVADLMNVTSARIYVLARSREASPSYTDTKTYTLGTAGGVGPFNDNFKRHVFTATVRLTNVAGRRVTP
jgi:type IV pilus assembly protein PilW